MPSPPPERAFGGAPPRLVGREPELAALTGMLDRAAHGDGGVAWVTGEGGIGKSTVAGALLRLASERGMATLTAAAEEFERHRPFALFADCLSLSAGDPDPHRARAARLLEPAAWVPVDGTLPRPSELEYAVGAAVTAIVEDLCARSPVLLILDDLQWADPPSLQLLGSLAARTAELPLVVVGLARGLPRREELLRLISVSVQRVGAVSLELGPLTAEAADTVAAAITGAPAGAHLRALVAACAGNPLYVGLVIDALSNAEAITLSADGEAEVPDPRPPLSIDATILGRLSALGRDCGDVLRLAAVLGSPFSLSDLSLLSGRSATALWELLREAVAAGFVVEQGDQLTLAHDIVRTALYRDLPASVRTGLHADFARALAAHGGEATTIAEHLLRGARPGDREAVAWLERAAIEVAPRGAAAAAELLEAALSLSDRDDPGRGRVMAALASTLLAAGRLDAGEEICRQAMEEAAYTPGRLRLTLIDLLFERGRVAEALAEAATIAVSGDVEAEVRAQALSWLVIGPLFTHDVEAADQAARAALEAGRQAGSVPVTALSLVRLSHVASFRGAYEEALTLTSEALQLAETEETDGAHRVSQPHLNHVLALGEADRPLEGIEVMAAARRLYEDIGLEATFRYTHHFASLCPFHAGRWDDALVELQTALNLSRAYGTGWTVDVLGLQAIMQIRRDELDTAAALLEEASIARAAGAPEFRLGMTEWACSLLDEAQGRPEEATERLWRVWATVTEAGILGEQRSLAPDLLRMLESAGDRARIRMVADAIGALASANPGLASLEALALRADALADDDAGQLLRAAERYPAGVRPYDRGLAYEDAAASLARSGDREAALSCARSALDAYGELRAQRDRARATARLRQAGLKLGARGPRRREQTGWGSLTSMERRVAELAADGWSNPQIAERLVVSRHTVATHISHILAKLELRSRFELAAERPPTR